MAASLALAGQEKADQMASTVVYTSTIADQTPVKLWISAGGSGRLMVGSNRGNPGSPVGLFEAALPAELGQRAMQAVSTREFIGAQTQESMRPGEPFRAIQVTGAGGSATKTYGRQLAAPAAFTRAEAELKPVMDYLRSHPVLAATLQVSGLPARLVAGQPQTIWLVLRNVGRTPFGIDNPSEWGKAGAHCGITATRRDAGPGGPMAGLQQFAVLDGKTFSGFSRPVEGKLISVGPGEQLEMRFQQEFAWAPAEYTVTVTLSARLMDEAGKPLLSGTLVQGPYNINVVPK